MFTGNGTLFLFENSTFSSFCNTVKQYHELSVQGQVNCKDKGNTILVLAKSNCYQSSYHLLVNNVDMEVNCIDKGN